ncbi:MAG: hypothetical protein ABID04_01625, partial [Patescibacteria group bacterium]
ENRTDNQVWLYDLVTEENTLVAENALFPFWVTPTRIVYNEIELCNGREGCGGMVDYESKDVVVYDLVSGTQAGNIPEVSSSYGMATLFH